MAVVGYHGQGAVYSGWVRAWASQGTVAGLLLLQQVAAWWRSKMLLPLPPGLCVGRVPPFSFWKQKWELGVASRQPSWVTVSGREGRLPCLQGTRTCLNWGWDLFPILHRPLLPELDWRPPCSQLPPYIKAALWLPWPVAWHLKGAAGHPAQDCIHSQRAPASPPRSSHVPLPHSAPAKEYVLSGRFWKKFLSSIKGKSYALIKTTAKFLKCHR